MILLVMGFFVTPVSAAVKKVPYLKTEKRVAIDKAFSLKLENNEKPVKWTCRIFSDRQQQTDTHCCWDGHDQSNGEHYRNKKEVYLQGDRI